MDRDVWALLVDSARAPLGRYSRVYALLDGMGAGGEMFMIYLFDYDIKVSCTHHLELLPFKMHLKSYNANPTTHPLT